MPKLENKKYNIKNPFTGTKPLDGEELKILINMKGKKEPKLKNRL